MRRCQPIRFGDLWSSYKSENPDIERKITAGSVPDVWAEVAGERIAAAAPVVFRRGILTVSAGSSALRNEIFINRETFRTALNEKLGGEVVRTVIVR